MRSPLCSRQVRLSWLRRATITRSGSPSVIWNYHPIYLPAYNSWRSKLLPGKIPRMSAPKPSRLICAGSHTRWICLPRPVDTMLWITTCSSCGAVTATTPPVLWWCWRASTGLPARLVVGYAPGHYDPSTGQVVITEAEAHSWPEIYFSGVGWVRFEPTGGRALSNLPTPPISSIAPEPPVLAVSPTPPVNCNILWLGLAGVGTIFLVLLGWREWQAANRKGTETLSYIYTQIRRRSRRLGARIRQR